MNFLYAFLAIVLGIVILKFILKLTLKIFITILVVVVLIATAIVVVVQPKMHKEFSFNVIEKVLKINDDGSTSVIQTTTTSERKRQSR